MTDIHLLDGPAIPDRYRCQGPDRHIVVGDPPRGRCSLWWREGPRLEGGRLGVIGHVEAGGRDDLRTLLETACAELAAAGCTRAAGPMDGTTWRRYRLVTWRGDEPPFFMEPTNDEEEPRWWSAAGFAPWHTYRSSVVDDLVDHDPRLEAVAARLADDGVRVRTIDPRRLRDELCALHALAVRAFQGNALYTDLVLDEFLAMYLPVERVLVPELTLVAERDGEPAGFVFALPDLARAERGEPVDTLVVKTLAVDPGRRCAGLGKLLLERVQHAAHERGFRRAIHALMHDGNASTRLGRGARTIRRYALFARELG